MQANELKVMILGPRCGKTTFINNITNNNNNFLPYINTTLGCEVKPYDLYVNNIKHRLNFCEVGSEYKGLKEEYCINSNFAIIFKKNNTNEHEEYLSWISNNIPIIYVNDYNINQNNDILDRIKTTIQNL